MHLEMLSSELNKIQELSKINVNAAKVFQDTARETAKTISRKREEYTK
jgi:hypothetical protein